MDVITIHREDVKAELRKRFGSLEAFCEARGLESQQVRDLLRGKSSTARAAVANELGIDPDHFVITSGKLPICGDDSDGLANAHRLSGAAN